MYRIVFAVDSDDTRAKQMVTTILDLPGERSDLDVVLLNVFQEFDVADDMGSADSAELYDESDFPESVVVTKAALEDAGIAVTLRREHGDPASEILAVADEVDADAIAVSGRKRSPAGKVLFGSVTQSVLLSAERPVIVTTD